MKTKISCKNLAKQRKPLPSSTEGTLANIGRVSHATDQHARPNRPVGNQHLRIDDALPRRPEMRCHSQNWRLYQPRRQGPFLRYVHENTPPPNCYHCCGPTQFAGGGTSCDHIVRLETRWQCTDSSCIGRYDEIVYRSPHGQYERRG